MPAASSLSLSFSKMNNDLKQSMLEYYQARVAEYDEVYQGKGPASISEPEAYTSEVEILSGIVRRECRGDLIDIGCGTAFWLPFYAESCSQITLFDQSDEMLAAANRRAASLGATGRTRSVCGDVLRHDFKDARFDSALVAFLLSHFTSAEEHAFFRKLKSILTREGTFLILDSVWTDARARARQKEGPQERSLNDGRTFQIYKKYFDERDLLSMQDAHGMDLVTGHFGKAFFASRGKFRKE